MLPPFLFRHNEDMEKVLVKRHREIRAKDGRLNEMRLRTAIEKLQVSFNCAIL